MYADLVLYNGEIVSMDAKHNTYHAIAIKNERIVDLGTDLSIKQWIGPDTNVIDLDGRSAFPGFIDAHQHLFIGGFNLLYVDCNQPSITKMVEVIREKASTIGSNDWIIGWGYDEAVMMEGRHPTYSDFAGIENPIYIARYCAHAAVVNKTVLELANITKETEVKNGEIVRDEDGEATGVLKEKAMDLVRNIMPPYTKAQMKNAITLVSEYNFANGITAVHEAGMGFFSNSLMEFEVLQEMALEGSLQLRIYAMILDEFFNQTNTLKLTERTDNNYLKIGSIKMFADGTVSGKTAAVSKEFNNSPGNFGMLMYTNEELEKKVLVAHKEGHQIAIHAIGDRAVEQVLNAYEKALKKYPRKDHRHRIEHAMVTNEFLLARMKLLEIIPVPQPTLVHQAGDVYKENLDPAMIDYVFANRKYFEYNLAPAGSSDFPITPSSPLLGMYAAMCRETTSGEIFVPENCLNLYESLQMYTSHAARASFDEDKKGTLEIGKLGDVTVLPRQFLEYTANEVKEATVEITIIGGNIVYQKQEIKTKEEVL